MLAAVAVALLLTELVMTGVEFARVATSASPARSQSFVVISASRLFE